MNPIWTWPEQPHVADAVNLTVNCETCRYWVPLDYTVVLPSDLVSEPVPGTGQFVPINQSGGAGSVSIGIPPEQPILEVGAQLGALELVVTGPSDHWSVYNYDQIGTSLSSISTLGYSTYTNATPTAPMLQMEINPGNESGIDAGVTYSSLNFEPYQQTYQVLVEGEWQTWNALAGNVWGTHLTGAPDGAPVS